MNTEETEKETSKFQSRKFGVWVIWLVLCLLVLVGCVATMIVTKQIMESMTGLIEKVISSFFAISMMYLGVNAGQKVGFAFAESLKKNEGENKGQQ